MITIEQLLQSRDARVAFQQKLLKENPDASLLCFTVQLPGPEKRNAVSLKIAKAGLEALQQLFPGCLASEKDLETGYEAYFLVPMEPTEVKRITCRLEAGHPLGRLMDLDVLGPMGAVSRASLGLEPRKCLLCDREVRYCMRARNHTTEELLARITKMVNEYEYGI